MLLRTTLLILKILLGTLLFAQQAYQSTVDSIEASIEGETSDTVVIAAYHLIAGYLRNHNHEKALEFAEKSAEKATIVTDHRWLAASYDEIAYCRQAMGEYQAAQEQYLKSLALHEKAKYEKGIANSLNDVGISYYYMGKYEDALGYFVQSGERKIAIGDSIGAARAYNNTGIMYDIAGKPGKAVESYLTAMGIYESAGREDLMLGTSLNIGIIYTDQKDYKNALKYYLKGVEYGEKGEDQAKLSQAYSNAGIAYDKLEKYDTALVYYEKSLALSEQIDFKKGIALAYTNIALNKKITGDPHLALEYYFKALPLKEELGNKSSIAITQIGIGDVYAELGEQQKALQYFKLALDNAQETGYMNYISDAYKGLSQAYGETGQYENAYKFQSLFIELKDSLLNEENTKIINELNTKYETEKKDKEIALMKKDEELLKEEMARKRLVQYAMTAGLVLMLLVAVLIFRSYAQKKKANAELNEKNIKIGRQRDEIREQKKDLTDSIRYAKEIQEAILPHDADIEQAFPHHFVLFLPKDIVSGDFYWFTQRGDTAFIAACDCTGHGVPGAFVSMIGNNLLNQIIKEKEISDPGEVLGRLNKGVKQVFTKHGEQEAQDGMDMTLCALDLKTREMKFAGANNPLFIVRKGIASSSLVSEGRAKAFEEDMAIIAGDKTAIGGATEMDHVFTTHELKLEQGDRFYLFSDGYPDQFGGAKGKKFMIKRLKELLVSFGQTNMPGQKEALLDTIENWKGTIEQVDDILVIGVEV